MRDREGVHAFFNEMHKHEKIIDKWLLMTSLKKKKKNSSAPLLERKLTPSDAPNELITMCKERMLQNL